LTSDERVELERHVRGLKIRAEDARRARVILILASGESYSMIEAVVPCYRDYINRWRQRFLAARLEGLQARYRGQPSTVLTPAMEAGVLEKTRRPPADGSALEYAQVGATAQDPSQLGRQGVAARGAAATSL
jgi:transposase